MAYFPNGSAGMDFDKTDALREWVQIYGVRK